MSGIGDAAEAILALALGGFIFIVVGGALSSSLSTSPMFDFRLWGVIYILVAIALAMITVYAAARSILSGL